MTLLVPIIFPREGELSDSNITGLVGFDIELFGYWKVPEGAEPNVVREEHAHEAQAKLYDLAAEFSRAGASTSVQMHFGPEGDYLSELQERIAEETEADAVVIPKQFTMWNNILVPLRDDRNADRIVEFLDAFDPDTIFSIELFHVATDEAGVESGRTMLERVEDLLYERGFTESDLLVTVTVSDAPAEEIAERARSHNLVVIGETEELSSADRFLGPAYERIAEGAPVPVVVVR